MIVHVIGTSIEFVLVRLNVVVATVMLVTVTVVETRVMLTVSLTGIVMMA